MSFWKRSLGVAVLAVAGGTAALPAAVVTNVWPGAWTVNAATGITFKAYLDATNAPSPQLRVESAWRGALLAGAEGAHEGMLYFDPGPGLQPGEPFVCSADSDALDQPYVWRATAQAAAGSGSFVTNAASVVTNLASGYLLGLAVADLNGDGAPDIVAPEWMSADVLIFLNQGDATFTGSRVTAGSALFYDVALADFTHDGRPDAVFGASGWDAYQATGTAAGSLTNFTRCLNGAGTDPLRRVATGDLNGDGMPDAVVVTELAATLVPLRNNGSGELVAKAPVVCDAYLYRAAIGDVNGDGAEDAVAVGADGYVALALNGGAGGLSLAWEGTITTEDLYACALVDLDQDGQVEVVAAGGGGDVRIGNWNGSALVFTTLTHGLSLPTVYGLATGDCDANGYPDLVLAGGSTLAVLLNADGSTWVSAGLLTFAGEDFRDVELADLNGDGALDVAACGLLSGTIRVLINTLAANPVVLGVDGMAVTDGAAPSLARGTDFGTVQLLTSETNTFTLRNDGAGPLTVSGTVLAGEQAGAFAVSGMPGTVQPGTSATFRVVFTPSTAGVYTASLAITNSAPASDPRRVYDLNLAGTAVKRLPDVFEMGGTNQVYEGTARPVTIDIEPLSLTVHTTYGGAEAAPTNAGQYQVIALVDDTSYTGAITGLLTVAQRELTVTTTNYVRGYGETNPVFAVHVAGYAPNEGPTNLTASPAAVCAATPASDAGVYPVTLGGGAATNYQFAYTHGTLTVTQQVLRVTAENKQRYFGEPNPPLTLLYSGLVPGETTNVLDVLPVVATTAGPTSPVGYYPITVSGGSDTNYAFVYSNAQLRVLAAPASIALTNLTQVYTGSALHADVITSPPGLPHTVTYDGSSNAPVNVGAYTAVAEIVDPGYAGTATGTFTIVKGSQTISFPAPATQWVTNTLVLGATASSGLPVSYDLLAGPAVLDGSNLTFSTSGTVWVAAAQAGDANWKAAPPVTQSVAVVKVPASVTLLGTNQVYDGTARVVAGQASPTGLTVVVTYDGSLSAPTNAGAYAVIGRVDDARYTGATTGLLSVARRPLAVQPDNQTREYGASNPVWTVQYAGFADGEGTNALSTLPAVSSPAVPASPVGAYPIAASNAAALNYTFSYSNATLTVTQAVLHAAADDQARPYGATNPVFTVSLSGWKLEDGPGTLDTPPSAACTATVDTVTGKYPITVSGGGDHDYAFSYSNGTLTIYASVAAVSVTDTNQVYDGTAHGVTVVTDPTGLVVNVTYDGAGAVPTNAGAYVAVATVDDVNYIGSATGTLTIAAGDQVIDFPAPPVQWATNMLTLSASASSGLPVAFDLLSGPATLIGSNMTFSSSGTVFVAATQAGDDNWKSAAPVTQSVTVVKAPAAVTLDQTSQVYDAMARVVMAQTDPTGLTVRVTYDGAAWAPTNAGSYFVSAVVEEPRYAGMATGTLQVARRALTIRPEDAVREYGDPNPAWTLLYSGFATNENTNALSVQPVAGSVAVQASPVGAYPIVASNAAAANYAITYSNGTLTVTQAVLQASADDQSRPYGMTNPVFTISYQGWKASDDADDLDTPPLAVSTAAVDTVVGRYPITVGGGADHDYALTYSNGTLTVYAATADVTISNTNQVYDTSARPVTVETGPTGLAVVVTYDGLTAAPTNAGAYAVVAVVDDANYVGTNIATLTVDKGTQQVTAFQPPGGGYPSEQVITLSATGTASGVPVVFAVLDGPGVLRDGNGLRFTGYGPVRVTAVQAESDNWKAAPARTNTYFAVDTNPVHYVALNGQASVWPYASWETAASNLQDAADVAAAGDTVLAGAGHYTRGGRAAAGLSLSNRVCVTNAVTVRADEGAAVTFIEGGAAMRGAFLTNGAVLAGFTVTAGHTQTNGAMMDRAGGGVWAGSGSVVRDCVLTGNAAETGAGLYGGTAVRTVLADNAALFDGGGAYGVTLNDCLVVRNSARYGGGVFRGRLTHATLARNTAIQGGGAYEVDLRNSIAYENAGDDVHRGTATNVCATSGLVHGVNGCTTNAPLFRDAAGGDFRLQHESPCVNAGSAALMVTNGPAGSTVDLDGEERVLHGATDLGAYEYNATPDAPVVRPATAVTAHAFQANWQAVAGTPVVRSYRLVVSNATDGAMVDTLLVDGALTHAAVTNVTPGAAYAYRVRAENEYAVSDWSAWEAVTALTEGSMRLAPAALAFDMVYGGTPPAAQSVTLTNAGQTAFDWSGTVTYGNGSGWLTLDAAAGTVGPAGSAVLSVGVVATNLDAGVYRATNTIASLTATNSPVRVAATFTIGRAVDTITFSATNRVYNGSPQPVTAVAGSGSSVELTYNGSPVAPTDAGVYTVTGVVEAVNWAATNVTTLVVAQAAQALAGFVPASGAYASTNTLWLQATGGGSGNPVAFSLVDGPGALGDGNRLRFTGYGTVDVAARQTGNANWQAAEPVTNRYTVVPVSNLTHYVALAGQTSVWPYASWEAAASVIQDAVDAAWDGDLVLVSNGVYAAGGRAPAGYSLPARLLVGRAVDVASVGGPALTVLAGAQGPAPVRPAVLTNGAALIGFTLAGGGTLDEQDLVFDRSGGGALLIDGALDGCVVQENAAAEYGGGVYLAGDSLVVNSLLCSNTAPRGAGAYVYQRGAVVGSTVADNAAGDVGGGVTLFEGGEVVNSIVYYNTGGDVFVHGPGGTAAHVCAGSGVTAGADGCITNAPLFADRPAGDYHLATNSPCVGAGSEAERLGELDIDGDPRLIDVVEMGADELAVYGPDSAGPTVRITVPVVTNRYLYTTAAVLDLQGTAVDAGGVVGVAAVNTRDGVSRPGAGAANWSVLNVPLYAGRNEVTVTATDLQGNTASVSLIVYRNRRPTRLDYDGDGLADMALYDQATNLFSIAGSEDGLVEQTWGLLPSDVAVSGDFDGDGLADVAVYQTNGTWHLARTTVGYAGLRLGGPLDTPVPADYDGDGRTDMAVYEPYSRTWHVSGTATGYFGFVYGQAGDVPVPADYDGDGLADPAVFRPSDQTWHIRGTRAGEVVRQWGLLPTDRPVPEDYDGDGYADIAVYQANGTWHIARTSLGYAGLRLGDAADTPVPADYDGDGLADLAVYQPNGTWHISRSTLGYIGYRWGGPEWVAVK